MTIGTANCKYLTDSHTTVKNHISQIFNHFEPMEKVLMLLSFQDTYYTDYVPQHSGNHTARRIHFVSWFVNGLYDSFRVSESDIGNK